MTEPQPIFCCEHAVIRKENKPYKDPYRNCHNALYRSFLAFAERKRRARSLVRLIRQVDSRSPTFPPPYYPPSSSPAVSYPVLTPEALENNPITPDTPYAIHLITRYDFGRVISHRYFICPANLEHDWREATLIQWFASGEPFKLKAHKWDFKCPVDSMFYRFVLMPNLTLRSMLPAIGIA
jgi:hypothetical protein